jgi:hypothetical protein
MARALVVLHIEGLHALRPPRSALLIAQRARRATPALLNRRAATCQVTTMGTKEAGTHGGWGAAKRRIPCHCALLRVIARHVSSPDFAGNRLRCKMDYSGRSWAISYDALPRIAGLVVYLIQPIGGCN